MADEAPVANTFAAPVALPAASADSPQLTNAHFDRVDWLSFGCATFIAFAGYWFTLAPNLTLEWSGMLSTGAMYAGANPPPGYPVWTLYSWLFTKLLPFSNIAWRVAIGSAVASALACGLVALMVSRGGAILFMDAPTLSRLNAREQPWLRVVCGVVAGLWLAFSGVVWESAVVVDIWALSLLLFVGVLTLLMRWMLKPEARRFLYAAFFLIGLLLTNSQELIVALPGMLVAMMLANLRLGRDAALFWLPLAAIVTASYQDSIWIVFPSVLNWPMLAVFVVVVLVGVVLAVRTRRVGTEWQSTMLCGFFFLLGLAFYLYVPIASMTTPPVNWGYARTVEGFFHVLSRGQFERLNPTNEPVRFVTQLWMWVDITGHKFGWLGLVLGVLPFCILRRVNRTARRWLYGLGAVWLGVAPLLIAELNPPPDRQGVELVELYFGASYVLLALWSGLGLMVCGSWLARPEKLAPS